MQRSGRRNDQYSSHSSVNDPSMPAEKRLRSDQRTGLDCIKQEYQEHHPAAEYAADPSKRYPTSTPQEMPPAAGQYGQGGQASGFGPAVGSQQPPYGYWPTSQGAGDSYPPADVWNSHQQMPIKQEFGSGYPEPGFPQHQQQQQDYNRSGFGSQSAPNSQAVGSGLAYSQMGEWNQAYGQAAQSQVQPHLPGNPPIPDTSGAYVTDPAMMAGNTQWGFQVPKVEPGIPPSTVPYGVSTSVPPPLLRPPPAQPPPGLPPASVPSAGLPPFSQFGMPARPPVEFQSSATGQPSMRLPPPQPSGSGQQRLLESGGYGGQDWNEQKPDVAAGRQGVDGGPQSRPSIPSLLSEEQMSAMRMGGSGRPMEREDGGDRGREFERGRESSWRDRTTGERRDRDRDGGRDSGGRGDRGQWGEDRSRQGRDSSAGRFRDQSRGERDRRDGARAGRDDRDR